jgi:2',3'-cyclic-nucleotide 2'-phosphodiesterase
MKILFIGDIYGGAGRIMTRRLLPEVKKKYSPNLTIANAENLTHGNGFSPGHIEEMQKAGVDFFTSGNHFMGEKEGFAKLDDPDFPVIRPANYPPESVPGRGYAVIEDDAKNKILIVNLMGRVFMKKDFDCPFRVMDKILEETADENLSAIFVDFHAEATSEKAAFGHYLDGRVSAVIGTHTHVATRDLQIFEGGTAYMSDVGFVGPMNSVIGVQKDLIINSFLTQLPRKLEPETTGKMVFDAVLVEVDEKSGKALNVEHVRKIS